MQRLSRRLRALTRRLSALPANRPGADKTRLHLAAQSFILHMRAIAR
ncbi:MAG: hypothetical protein NTY77_11170 [Elusimicrobia bacterium]|nr:hypothetical protein [Elusimicrobiota bacterium]